MDSEKLEGLVLAPGVRAAPSEQVAAWLPPRLLKSPPAQTLAGAVVPIGFPTYARIFHPADDRLSGQSLTWREVALATGREFYPEAQWEGVSVPVGSLDPVASFVPPYVGHAPEPLRRALVEILSQYPTGEEECYIAVWNGLKEITTGLSDWPMLRVPFREYFLGIAPFSAIAEGIVLNFRKWESPHYWWSKSLSWCVATEIDLSWTYVGGNADCIEEIIASRDLEALRCSVYDRADLAGDKRNLSLDLDHG